jgi:SAM-dependent methyltransferase
MAKAQSKGFKIRYINDDFCLLDTKNLDKYDLCIDAHFMHCITDNKDRKNVLRKIREILKPGGIFIFMSMCSPVSRKNLAKAYKGQKIDGNIIYIESGKYGDFQDLRIINGKKYLPMRYIAHWKKLLSELKEAGFSPMVTQYVRYDKNDPKEPTGILNVAAIRK